MKNQFKLLTLGTLSLIAASCGNKVTMPDPLIMLTPVVKAETLAYLRSLKKEPASEG